MNWLDSSTEYLRAKRDQYLVEIRKTKNSQVIKAKRKKVSSSLKDDQTEYLLDNIDKSIQASDLLKELAIQFIEALPTRGYKQLTDIAERLRRKLSTGEEIPITELINTGVVADIASFVDPEFHENDTLLIECMWIIINVASGDDQHVGYLIGLGIIPKTIALLDHTDNRVQENALWILSNISAESKVYREIILQMNIAEKLWQLFSTNRFEASLLSHMAWLVTNLCTESASLPFDLICPLLLIIQSFILNSNNKTIHISSLWAIFYLTSEGVTMIEEIFALDIVKRIIELLDTSDLELKTAAVKVISNLFTGTDDHIQYLLDCNLLEELTPLLNHPKKSFRNEAAWVFSNILACGPEQIHKILNYNSGTIMEKLKSMIFEEDIEISQKCVTCLCNATSRGTMDQVQALVQYGLIEIVIDSLKECENGTIIINHLEALGNIFEKAKSQFEMNDSYWNEYIERFEHCNGLIVLERLQVHPNNDVSHIVEKFIKDYLWSKFYE